MKIKDVINSVIRLTGYTLIKHSTERRAIIEAVKLFGDKEIVACEIGTFEGEHALHMLENLNIKKLYLIDPYENYSEYRNDKNQHTTALQVNKAKIKAHKLLKNYGNRIVWIEKYGNDAVDDVPEVDFIY